MPKKPVACMPLLFSESHPSSCPCARGCPRTSSSLPLLTSMLTPFLFPAFAHIETQVGPRTLAGWFYHYFFLLCYTVMHTLLTPVRAMVQREKTAADAAAPLARSFPPLDEDPLVGGQSPARKPQLFLTLLVVAYLRGCAIINTNSMHSSCCPKDRLYECQHQLLEAGSRCWWLGRLGSRGHKHFALAPPKTCSYRSAGG